MMYPYMTLADETEIVHSQIIEKEGQRKVIVNFERPTENGFDHAFCCHKFMSSSVCTNLDFAANLVLN